MSTKKMLTLTTPPFEDIQEIMKFDDGAENEFGKKSLNRMLMCGFQYQFQKIFLDPADFDDVLFY